MTEATTARMAAISPRIRASRFRDHLGLSLLSWDEVCVVDGFSMILLSLGVNAQIAQTNMAWLDDYTCGEVIAVSANQTAIRFQFDMKVC